MTILSPSDQFQTWATAAQHGGGFVRALAAAWIVADADNKRRIEDAFPEVLRKYGPGSMFFAR